MLGGMNPAKMQGMMKKMGISQTPLNVRRVVFEMDDTNLVINDPQVLKVMMQGQETYQVTGEAEEESSEDFSEDDVSMVKEQTGKSEDEILEIKSIKELRSMLYLGSKEGFKKIPLPKEAQMSNIQDFIVESIDGNVKVKFVGNHYDYVTELGKNMSNSGGEITDFENFKFNTYKSLNLPNSFNGRRIHKLSSNQYLIVLNNNHSYILTPNYEKQIFNNFINCCNKLSIK